MTDDDSNLFREQLDGVRPLKKTNRAILEKPQSKSESLAHARRAAVEATGDDSLAEGFESVSDDYVDMLSPSDVLAFKRSGIQDGVYRKLRLGKYTIEGRLDLHRKTVKEARDEVMQFIREAMAYDMRTVLILHGKGERNIERPAVIKSHVAKWLKEMPDVMAYHSAQQHHGGRGAVYVMLRKSDKEKERARELFGRRG